MRFVVLIQIKWLDNYENEVYEGSIIAWKEIVTPKEI